MLLTITRWLDLLNGYTENAKTPKAKRRFPAVQQSISLPADNKSEVGYNTSFIILDLFISCYFLITVDLIV